MASAHNSSSEHSYISEPTDDLKCVLCQQVAEDPRQHCGSLFCRKCLNQYGYDKPCKKCNAEHPEYYEDTKSKREINALRVKCDNIKRNCRWEGTVGTLEAHVAKCEFTLLPCPNQCTEHQQTRKLMRKHLERHVEKECPNRDYKCEHCGLEGGYTSITLIHDAECEKKITPCTNTVAGCTKTMPHEDIEEHVELECEYTVIACKFKNIGCTTELERGDMAAHERNDSLHLSCALDTIVKVCTDVRNFETNISERMESEMKGLNQLQESVSKLGSYALMSESNITILNKNILTLKSIVSQLSQVVLMLESNIGTLSQKVSTLESMLISILESTLMQTLESSMSMLSQKVSTLESTVSTNDFKLKSSMSASNELNSTLKDGQPFTFKLERFQQKKERNETFTSPSFYTNPGGYHMAVQVVANGSSTGHVTVTASIQQGKYDAQLKWPLAGKVTVTLMNQLKDNKHFQKTSIIVLGNNARVGPRPSVSIQQFIPHIKLAHNSIRSTQFLMDDTLYFRVSVEVSDHKPWLECTTQQT